MTQYTYKLALFRANKCITSRTDDWIDRGVAPLTSFFSTYRKIVNLTCFAED